MTDTAPRTIKAYAAYELGLEVKPFEYTSRVLGDDDVEIAITHCGVCGSDLHIISGGWGGAKCPIVPGHEIVGTVTKRGANVTELALGDRVGVGALVFACLDRANCAGCASDIELRCKDCVLTYGSVYKDGEKSYGGYAEHVRVSSKYAFKIPDSIPSDLAAPLLCAGANVYKPMKQYVTPGMRVGVLGIGGAGHLAVQFAKALGATPVAFSHSADKEQDARSLGAEDFVLTGDAAQVAKAARSVDVLFVTSDAKNQPFDSYMSLVKFGGRIVLVGLPEDKIVISPFALANSEVSVVGTNAGGIRHMKEMFALAAEKNVRPIIQKHPMSEANAAIQQVHNGTARYRIVLEN